MPSAVVKSIADKTGLTKAEVEKHWKKAKEIISNDYEFKQSNPKYWKLVTTLTRKMSKLKETYSATKNFLDYYVISEAIENAIDEVSEKLDMNPSIQLIDNVLELSKSTFITNLNKVGFTIKELIQENEKTINIKLETSYTSPIETIQELVDKECFEEAKEGKEPKDIAGCLKITKVDENADNTQFILKSSGKVIAII